MEVSLNCCAALRVYKKNTTPEESHCLGPEYKVKFCRATESSSQTCCTKREVQKWREDSSFWNLRGKLGPSAMFNVRYQNGVPSCLGLHLWVLQVKLPL